MRRVVVTGMGGVTAFGDNWSDISSALKKNKTAICYMKEWEFYRGVNTRLAAPIIGFDVKQRYPRKKLRSMGRVSRLAVYASEKALETAGLIDDPVINSGRMGVAYGSSFGSPDAVLGFYELKIKGISKHLNATNYLRMMSQTTVVNLSVFFGITGRIIPTSCACASGSMAIGQAYEAIQYGKADIMLAGGAEELDITDVATFDTLFATSTKNDIPSKTPRPFDAMRDGLVIGEGAGSFVLEEYEHAKARGATIYAEIVGFGCNADGSHITQPQKDKMSIAMKLALQDSNINADKIDYVNAHGTATSEGDVAESHATNQVFGKHIPISTFKGHLGHTLGACGAIEAWFSIEMMRDKCFYPTANLKNIDKRCGELDYIMHKPRSIDANYMMSNNFAFGGINTSLIFKRFS